MNKPLVQINAQGIQQTSPYTKDLIPPGDPYASKGKKQYQFVKYA